MDNNWEKEYAPMPSKTHYILNDLEQLPRVTSINKFVRIDPKYLDDWLVEHGMYSKALLDQAGKEGSQVHQGTEKIDAGEYIYMDDYYPKAWECLCRYKNFYDRYIQTGEIVYLDTERRLINKDLGFAGTIDRLCYSPGDDFVFVLDFKTSNNIYLDHWIQQGAYWRLLMEEDLQSDYEDEIDFQIKRIDVCLLHLKSAHRTEKDYQGVGWKFYSQLQNSEELWKMFNMKKYFYDRANKLYSPKLYPTKL